MKLFRKEEGFTLVELMVVVLIIGILVAIAIPVFNAASASARKSACQANLRTLDGALEQWRAADVGNDVAALDAAAAEAALTNAADPYVKVWPACPTDGDAYTMAVGDEHFTCPNGHTYP